MDDKTDLHQLIEKLPKSQVPTVRTFLGYVLAHSSPEELSDDAHDNAPYDDEDYPDDVIASLAEAHEEYQRGETFSLEEIELRYSVG